jgi:two-component system chemotaxis response regulator CheB
MELAGGITGHVRLRAADLVAGHRPSVDMLFHSVAALGRQAIGVILTGMGSDGAEGLLAMRRAGARTFGQNQASCVVYGMPRAAAEQGAVEKEVSLSVMPEMILAACRA